MPFSFFLLILFFFSLFLVIHVSYSIMIWKLNKTKQALCHRQPKKNWPRALLPIGSKNLQMDIKMKFVNHIPKWVLPLESLPGLGHFPITQSPKWKTYMPTVTSSPPLSSPSCPTYLDISSFCLLSTLLPQYYFTPSCSFSCTIDVDTRLQFLLHAPKSYPVKVYQVMCVILGLAISLYSLNGFGEHPPYVTKANLHNVILKVLHPLQVI